MYRKGDNVYYTPDELGYQDRGMVKWQGFILADHMEQMLAVEHEKRDQPALPELSAEECAARLWQAYERNQVVALQLNTKEDGSYPKEMSGQVLSVEEGQLYLQGEAGLRCLPLELIRHVRLAERSKWFEKDEERRQW